MADGCSKQHNDSVSRRGGCAPVVDSARANGIRYGVFGETGIAPGDLEASLQAVPAAIAPALNDTRLLLCAAGVAPERLRHTPPRRSTRGRRRSADD